MQHPSQRSRSVRTPAEAEYKYTVTLFIDIHQELIGVFKVLCDPIGKRQAEKPPDKFRSLSHNDICPKRSYAWVIKHKLVRRFPLKDVDEFDDVCIVLAVLIAGSVAADDKIPSHTMEESLTTSAPGAEGLSGGLLDPAG